jgi:iron(III) transport system substrate-binding protein
MDHRHWYRRATSILAAMVLLAVAAACAPGSSPGSSAAPAQPPMTARGQDVAGRDSSEWPAILAAARQEGKVSISGPASADAREALIEGFERKYPGVRVDYTGSPGAAVPPKLMAEREAGQFLVDLIINGNTTQFDLIEAGVIDPIAPYLVGPDIRDTAPWLGGKLEYLDTAERHAIVYANYVRLAMTYNPGLVASGEIRSYTDLLNPKWRGKITMFDPRVPGAGLVFATGLYAMDGLGKEYLRQLFAQQVAFSRDERQIVDWVIRGHHAVALGPSERIVTEFRNKGVPVHTLGAPDLREGSYLTAAASIVGVTNRAPHPNAARVYLNWLLSREGQADWAKATGFASRRTDVPTDHLPDYAIPRPGVRYLELWKEEYNALKDEIVDLGRAAAGS